MRLKIADYPEMELTESEWTRLCDSLIQFRDGDASREVDIWSDQEYARRLALLRQQ